MNYQKRSGQFSVARTPLTHHTLLFCKRIQSFVLDYPIPDSHHHRRPKFPKHLKFALAIQSSVPSTSYH